MTELLLALSLALNLLKTTLIAQAQQMPDLPPPVFASFDSNRIVPLLVQCETSGKSVKTLDINGKYSYGVLQFQMDTWNEWSEESGISGDPMNPIDAFKMGHWAISHGLINHWHNCAVKNGLL